MWDRKKSLIYFYGQSLCYDQYDYVGFSMKNTHINTNHMRYLSEADVGADKMLHNCID